MDPHYNAMSDTDRGGNWLKAAAAGVVDPLGIPSALLRSTLPGYSNAMINWRSQAPMVADATSLLVPGIGGLRLAGMAGRELAPLIVPFMGVGVGAGQVRDAAYHLMNMPSPPQRLR